MRQFAFAQLVIAVMVAAVLPSRASGQGIWVDPSPHVRKFIKADGDTKVEVLDWGGQGRPLVLLSQLGQTAHIYDDWAMSLVRDYRVLAITRRGYGQSTSGSDDYSTQRLAQDVLAVIDAEHLQKPILVGNGLAGEELSWIGVNAPERVAGLVYLDAAYDRRNVGAEAVIARRIPTGSPAAQDMSSVQAVVTWMSKGLGGRIPEAEVRQLAALGPDGRVVGERTSSRTGDAVLTQLKSIDPSGIRVPVLAMYATRASVAALPGCQAPKEPSVKDACDELFAWMSAQLDRSKRLFGGIKAKAQIVDLPGANSFMFLSNRAEVTNAVVGFASDLPR